MIEILGWASSLILLTTIVKQVHKQWTSATSEGVSQWLFLGQLAASVGFSIYSIITASYVFAFTNISLAITNTIGIILYYKFRTLDEN